MPQLLQLQNYRGKGMEDGEKVSLCRFLAGQKIASSWKKSVLGHSVYRPPKMSLKLAV